MSMLSNKDRLLLIFEALIFEHKSKAIILNIIDKNNDKLSLKKINIISDFAENFVTTLKTKSTDIERVDVSPELKLLIIGSAHTCIQDFGVNGLYLFLAYLSYHIKNKQVSNYQLFLPNLALIFEMLANIKYDFSFNAFFEGVKMVQNSKFNFLISESIFFSYYIYGKNPTNNIIPFPSKK